MRKTKRGRGRGFSDRIEKLMILALVIAVFIPWAGLLNGQSAETMVMELWPASQTAMQKEEPKVQAETPPEKIVAGPQNIKEKTAIYIFLGWVWVSIGVLVYILRLKIREVDRLHSIRYFTPDKK